VNDKTLWVDKQGDVWTPGADGLMHTPETAPFPREYVEKKWGPLKPLGKKAAGRELDGRTWDEFPS
jgi:protein gp37